MSDNTLYNANGLAVHPGDAILTFLDEDPANEGDINYDSSAAKASAVAAGVMNGRSDYVIAPATLAVVGIRISGNWVLIAPTMVTDLVNLMGGLPVLSTSPTSPNCSLLQPRQL